MHISAYIYIAGNCLRYFRGQADLHENVGVVYRNEVKHNHELIQIERTFYTCYSVYIL